MDALPPYLTGLLAVLLLTSFVKILTTLSIMRYGLGLGGAGFGLVILGFAFALSLLVVSPQLDKSGGIDALFQGKLAVDKNQLEQNFRPFLEKHADQNVLGRLKKLAERLAAPPPASQPRPAAEQQPQAQQNEAPASFSVLISAFLLSELKEAFLLGFLFIVPFLVIDLVVANALLALGVSQMPMSIVSLPLKILLFFVVDGWSLVSEKLIGSYI